jgi:hypothetical protein
VFEGQNIQTSSRAHPASYPVGAVSAWMRWPGHEDAQGEGLRFRFHEFVALLPTTFMAQCIITHKDKHLPFYVDNYVPDTHNLALAVICFSEKFSLVF